MGVGGWSGRVGGVLRLPFRHSGTSCVPREPSHGPPTTLQGKAGCLVMVMDNWEQFHTNAILFKPAKHCHSPFRAATGKGFQFLYIHG